MKIRYQLAAMLLTVAIATPVWAIDYTNHWARPAIEKWTGHGIVAGYDDGSFKPNNHVTRAELAAFITRTFGLVDQTGARAYKDITSDKWYVDPIGKVSSRGIMYTPGDNFYPNQKVTREEAAYAIYRAYQLPYTENQSLVDYKDYEYISTWAADAIGSLVAGGYMQGYEDNTFRPQGNITRAEIVKMLDNLSPHYLTEAKTYTQNMKGNVIIKSKDVVLKDMTIEGNLYLTEDIGSGQVTLDNVKVTGTVYVSGSTLTMSGDFQTIDIASGKPVHMKKGTAQKIMVSQAGTTLTLDKGTVTEHLMILEEVTLKGEGKVVKTSDFRGEKLALAGAGIYIRDTYYPVPVEGNKITIDLPSLGAQYGYDQLIEGLQINATIEGAYVNSYAGQMKTNTRYDFRMANKVTGILDEMLAEVTAMSGNLLEIADIMGITGESAFDLLGIGNSISIYTMIDKYNLAADMVRGYAGINAPDEYTFTRQICYGDEKPVDFTIHLIVNHR